MKKKGLLISTIVMVVVLIAALTTSTYAWFQTSSVTSIDGFSVSIESDTAVNIGFKSQYSYSFDSTKEIKNQVKSGDFVSQTVTFNSAGASATISNPGSWSGYQGLYSQLSHNIKWGSQKKAVGVAAASSKDGATLSNTGTWSQNFSYDTDKPGTVVAANGNSTELSNVTKANANNAKVTSSSEVTDGDYVHFILGVSPSRDLQRNSLIVMIEPTSDSLGVLASIHVAYRVTLSSDAEVGSWNEVDIYNGNDTEGHAIHWNTEISKISHNLTNNAVETYKTTYSADSVPAGAYALEISGLDTTAGKISQIELVIYMAGVDDDCNGNGLLAKGDMKIFFDTANVMTVSKDSSGHITVNLNDKNYVNNTNSLNGKVYLSTDATGTTKAEITNYTLNADTYVFTSTSEPSASEGSSYTHVLVTDNAGNIKAAINL